MSEFVTFSKDEWEAFLRDSEKLIGKYNALLKRANELEDSKRNLEQRLRDVEGQLRRAEEGRRAVEVEKEKELTYGRENIRRLHSQVSRLLEEEIPESDAAAEVQVVMRETVPSIEPPVSSESKSVEDVLRERREAVRKLLDESEET